MSLLQRKWLCLDDGEVFVSEDDYCFHALCNPWHRIVADDTTQWNPRFQLETDHR